MKIVAVLVGGTGSATEAMDIEKAVGNCRVEYRCTKEEEKLLLEVQIPEEKVGESGDLDKRGYELSKFLANYVATMPNRYPNVIRTSVRIVVLKRVYEKTTLCLPT